MAFYGIYNPIEKCNLGSEDESTNVFTNETDAFKMLKKHRESRLKKFKTHDEAKYFSLYGREISETTLNGNGTPSNASPSTDDRAEAVETGLGVYSPVIKATSTPVGEKVSNFRGPTSQELVKFRKNIEQGKCEEVHTTVWSNPRYLISSGDTPTILKESFRYNALHVAALAKNAKMCSLILEIVSDIKFIQLFYGKDNARTAEEVSPILLDLYLNMPEKGRSETPLHLAVKFGALEVVEVLTTYKECQMNPNTDGKLPKDIICDRFDGASSEIINRIRSLLQERFYVPVIRSVDNSLPPIIGEPFSPTQSIMSLTDPLSPEMEIKAIAGPMNKDQAETFRKRWKTPPRGSPRECQQNVSGSPRSPYPSITARTRFTPVKVQEAFDGLADKTPRRLFDGDTTLSWSSKIESDGSLSDSQEFVHPPSRSFLSSAKKNLFSNYRDRLFGERFNDSLDDSVVSAHNVSFNDSVLDTPGFQERNLKLADVDKGLEVVGRCLAKAQNVGWKEFWSFLDEFIDIASSEGLNKLENYLQQKIDEKMKPPQSLPLSLPLHHERFSATSVESSPMSSMCRNLNKFHLSRDPPPSDNSHAQQSSHNAPSSPSAFHVYLCVEKSCQVFAKRLMKPITQPSNNLVVVNDALTTELGRLKSLVCSYKEDPRFFAIDFRAAHSRFAHVLVSMLKESADVNDNGHNCNIDNVASCLRQILLAKEKALTSNPNNNNGLGETTINVQQLICLIKFILKRVDARNDVISPETLTTEQDCFDVWSAEEKCDCDWTNHSVNNKTARSIKRRLDISYKMSGLTLNATTEQGDEDEEYWSINESENDDDDDDAYFTPPSTPTSSFFEDDGNEHNHKNFIFGEEPTKMDHDVFKALHNVEINEKTHPNIYQWYTALQNYSLEERENFPPSQRCNAGPPTLSSKEKCKMTRLFQPSSPIKEISPRFGLFHLKPSLLSNKL